MRMDYLGVLKRTQIKAMCCGKTKAMKNKMLKRPLEDVIRWGCEYE